MAFASGGSVILGGASQAEVVVTTTDPGLEVSPTALPPTIPVPAAGLLGNALAALALLVAALLMLRCTHRPTA